MSSASQKFVLTGPNAGRTLTVNGHEFVDGQLTFHGSAAQIATLGRVFSFYGVLPADQAELAELRAAKKSAGPDRKALDEAMAGLPGGNTDAGYVVSAMAAHFGELFTEADAARVHELVKPEQGKPTDPPAKTQAERDADEAARVQAELDAQASSTPTLAEAIGMLDPAVDGHWTSNNLPALDVLEELTGKKPARSEVDAVAEGYTRAKARAAKQ